MRRVVIVAIASSAQGTCFACLDRHFAAVLPSAAVGPAQGPAGAAAYLDRARLEAAREGYVIEAAAVACSDEAVSRAIRREASTRLPCPVATVPFAHAALAGERLRGAAVGRGSALLLDTDTLATGLLLNGSLYRGSSGRAGSVAHLGLDRTGGLRCHCGRTGCLSALVAAGEDAPMPPLPAGSRPLPSRRLGWFAVALVTLLNTVNPEVLILAGAAVGEPDDLEWLADTARLGCLTPTRAGLVGITRARPECALVGAVACISPVRPSTLPEEG